MLRTALPAAIFLFASPALAQDPHGGHGAHEQHPQEQPAPQQPPAHDHAAAAQGESESLMVDLVRTDWPIDQPRPGQGLLGAYPMSRDASGTAWQPDASEHGGLHAVAGDWMLMGHALFNGVYDWQDGPRGDEKAFLAGMIMGSARRDFAAGTLTLRAMLSPDPAMGAEGYPLLFAAGETADGVDTLIDRQHPHDLIMELSASYSHRLGASDSVFVYAGLPGEPAFGPPTFMHRMSAMDFPEAPISHHWLDSTHITFGVLTAGWVHENWKFEASRFRGREPDEHRTDIESGALDSTSARVSWNPSEHLSLQASWADVASPEALEPELDETRISVSGIYTREIFNGWWSATLAFANKDRSDGVALDAWLGEAALHPNENWTLFARAEAVETDELSGHGGPIESVQRVSLGVIRDWRIHEHAIIGIGAMAQQHFASDALEPTYGGDPQGAMGFVRLKVG